MQCPIEIAQILCEILRSGLLRIRACSDANMRTSETDHLHNLPGPLADYKPELLAYYWRVERVSFTKSIGTDNVQPFEPLWQALAKYVAPSEGAPVNSPQQGLAAATIPEHSR